MKYSLSIHTNKININNNDDDDNNQIVFIVPTLTHLMSARDSLEQFIVGLSDSLIGFASVFIRRQSKPSLADASTLSPQKPSSGTALASSAAAASNSLKLSRKLHDNIFFICKLNGLIFLTIVFYLNYIFRPIFSWLIEKFVFTQIQFMLTFLIGNLFDLIIVYSWSLSCVLLYFSFQIFILRERSENGKRKFCFIFVIYGLLKRMMVNTLDVFIVFAFEIVLFVQSLLMVFIPIGWLSRLFFHMHFAYLLSFLVFNFKWSLMSWNLHTRIKFIESRFSYFLGFGLVLSVVLALPESFIYSAVLASFLFPIFLFNAIETQCEHLKPVPIRFPVFDFTFALFRFVSSFIGAKAKFTN